MCGKILKKPNLINTLYFDSPHTFLRFHVKFIGVNSVGFTEEYAGLRLNKLT